MLLAPFGFAGEWTDAATGLQYLRARWYDPATGRFTQVDPFPGLLSLPGTQHPYAYALNNPLRYTDPSGECINILIGAGVGAAVGAGAYALSAALAGQPINGRDLAVVAATGAIAGALVGSGLVLPALIGSSGGFAGLGYLSGISMTGSQFCMKDFGIAVGIGAISGALMPTLGSTWLGVISLNVLANTAQYGLMELTSLRRPTWDGLAWSALGGAFSGAIGGPYQPVPSRYHYDLNVNYLSELNRAATRRMWREMFPEKVLRNTIKELPRSFFATVIGNLPNPLPEP